MLKTDLYYRIRAWLVHLYTSLGLICALGALVSIVNGNARATFIYFGISLFIDATDGTMARKFNVKLWASNFDGRKLDDITDYLTYAFLPIFFVYKFQMVNGWGVYALGFVLIAAAYGFCQCGAKTSDGYFTGFPNFWNLVVFYLFIFKISPLINVWILLILALLIFVPVKYVSYSTRNVFKLNAFMSLLYGIVLGVIVADLHQPPFWLVWGSLVFPLYYVGISVFMTRSETRRHFMAETS